MSGSKSGATTRKDNGRFKPGQSGNPKGKRALAGNVDESVIELARSTQAEAFAIVQEIARNGENEGERLRAARLWLEIGAQSVESDEADESLHRVKWQDTDYKVPRG